MAKQLPLPDAPELEAALLGSMMHSPDAIDVAVNAEDALTDTMPPEPSSVSPPGATFPPQPAIRHAPPSTQVDLIMPLDPGLRRVSSPRTRSVVRAPAA